MACPGSLPTATLRGEEQMERSYDHAKVQGEMGRKAVMGCGEQSTQTPLALCYEKGPREEALFPYLCSRNQTHAISEV